MILASYTVVNPMITLGEYRAAKVTRYASLQCHCDDCRPIPFGRFNPTVFVCGRCGGNATDRKEE